VHDVAEFDDLLNPARCCSASKSRAASSARCGAAIVRRCWWRPTPPTRSPPARRWHARHGGADRAGTRSVRRRPAVDAVRDQGACALQPGGVLALNIVPGLVGTILTMTMLIFTRCR